MDDLTTRMAAEYNLSRLRKEAEIFPRSQDREKFHLISNRYKSLTKAQTRAYEKSYEQRLNMAAEQICERRGKSWNQIRSRRDGNGLALQRRVTRAAHRDVQSDHLRRMTVIRNREAGELQELVDTVRQRQIEQQEQGQEQGPMSQSHIPNAPKMLTDQRGDPARQIVKRSR